MSPTEDMRKQAYALLADSATGLNPEFVRQCHDRSIPVPVPAQGGTTTAPFNFGRNSSNVFQAKTTISFLENEVEPELQYPFLMLYGMSVTQIMDTSRVMGMIGSVTVALEIQSFLGWAPEGKPPNNDFESALDALEESFFNVLNRDAYLWHSPVLYRNDLNVRERFPVAWANENQILRTGLRLNLSARYEMG